MKLIEQIEFTIEDWEKEEAFVKINIDNLSKNYKNYMDDEIIKLVKEKRDNNTNNKIDCKYIYYEVHPYRYGKPPANYPDILRKYNSLLKRLRNIIFKCTEYSLDDINNVTHNNTNYKIFLQNINNNGTLVREILNEGLDIYLRITSTEMTDKTEYEGLLKEYNGDFILKTLLDNQINIDKDGDYYIAQEKIVKIIEISYIV